MESFKLSIFDSEWAKIQTSYSHWMGPFPHFMQNTNLDKQAGAEMCQAQAQHVKLGQLSQIGQLGQPSQITSSHDNVEEY